MVSLTKILTILYGTYLAHLTFNVGSLHFDYLGIPVQLLTSPPYRAGCYTASALYCTCSGATDEVCRATKQQNGGRGANVITSPRRGCAVEKSVKDLFRAECKKAFPTIREKDNRCLDKVPSGI